MKTQISRDSYQLRKRYSGVYQQQGRMITDADWNELTEIVKRRLDDALRDVVASGAPRKRGVEITQSAVGEPLAIRPGYLYVDGVIAAVVAAEPASLFGLDDQADLPLAAGVATPTASYVVYADVWERPVISLEDPDQLRDPGLHGADTTTRTRTMAQLKWCADTVDPEDPAVNPQQGDAELTVVLRSQSVEQDPCDPCAEEVSLATRTGNYLFRVEIHDVQGPPAAPTRLTLKWSSENGAEQHAVGGETEDFKSGDWIYEFYNAASEKHLGVHLDAGFDSVQGQLEEGYPSTPPEDYEWVRRWDGYCVLEQSSGVWSLVAGRDRDDELSTTRGSDEVGHVVLGESVRIRLQALDLALTVKDATFVTGDYWLAPIREAVHEAGNTVLAGEAPAGILHHYLRLASVDAAGELEAPATDQLRRLNFPPLTDLRAGDVGYETDCPSGLFDASHDTVEKALDRICEIAAEHVAYQTDCPPSSLFDASHDTVGKALDRICEIAAEHVAYVADSQCADLQGAKTVQEALDALCLRPAGGGCRVTVGEGGDFEQLEVAIEELLAAGEVHLCLLPGKHVMPGGVFAGDAPHTVDFSVTGCGVGTWLSMEATAEFKELNSLMMSGFVMLAGEGKDLIVSGCKDVEISSLRLARDAAELLPVLRISQADRIRLQQNMLEAEVFIEDAQASTTIADNEITGKLILYGGKAGTDLSENHLGVLSRLMANGAVTFEPLDSVARSLQIRNSRLSGLGVSNGTIVRIAEIAAQDGGELTGLFETIQLTDNVIEDPGNQIASKYLNLSSTVFKQGDSENRSVGWTLAQSAILVGNHGHKLNLQNLSVDSGIGANTLEIV